jgi:3-oxoacyl-[acyl-carrier protein] reductase
MVHDGASVAMVYANRTSEAEKLRNELAVHGQDVLAIQADVGAPLELSQTLQTSISHFGGLDIIVAVAGTAKVGAIETLTNEDFDESFSVNVRAPFIAAREASQVMTPGGRIIFIGSIVADRSPGTGGTLYAASKAALGGMTRALARELGERGITVNLVQPGPTDTERNPADGPNAALNRSPLAIPRHGTPDEVAGLVAYLASAEAGFVTGATYNIDGGWSA